MNLLIRGHIILEREKIKIVLPYFVWFLLCRQPREPFIAGACILTS